MINRISIRTVSRVEFQDITRKVRDVVGSSGVRDGTCHVFIPHTTAGIVVNEHADPDVVADIMERLELAAPQLSKYHHVEGNAPAHIKASLMGNSLTLFIESGDLVLGTWQGIFFCEFDGPRSRTALIKVSPDKQ